MEPAVASGRMRYTLALHRTGPLIAGVLGVPMLPDTPFNADARGLSQRRAVGKIQGKPRRMK